MNVDKCKITIFSKLRDPIVFPYKLGQMVLDRVNSINDLRVIMDQKMCFTENIDVKVGKALAMLRRFMRRVSGEFRDPYILKALQCFQNLNMRVVCDLLFMMYTSIVLNGCSGSLLDLYCVVWDRLICTICLLMRTSVLCLTLTCFSRDAPRYQTRGGDFFRVRFLHTSYGVHKPFKSKGIRAKNGMFWAAQKSILYRVWNATGSHESPKTRIVRI
jgi:hypothetical protein